MKRFSNCYSVVPAVATIIFSIGSGGCKIASQSTAPSEILKDPLGIDRAINDYYFPDTKQPKETWRSAVQISKNEQ